MSANDYYNTRPQQESQQPYYQSYQPPLQHLPSYHSQAPTYSSQRPPDASPVSPFEAPFDDHVYPMGGMDPHRMDSQSTIGGDSRYYGQGGGGRPAADSTNSFREDIPLRDHPGGPLKDNNDVTDHVYDAPVPPPQMMEEGRSKRKSGLGFLKSTKKRIPWVVYILTTVQVAVFIAEIVKNAVLTKSPIEIHPSFNPMIGPSPYVLINMGSRYVPCMHTVDALEDAPTEIDGVPFQVTWPCPNTTTSDALCTLGELCGFGADVTYMGTSNQHAPNQWFRFIIPIFMHAGLIHIGFNMLLQMTLGREMEVAIGPVRFFIVYFASGIFGFVLGGNFAADGISSTGASGALFGVIALTLLDLFYTWSERISPWKDLGFIAVDVVISFVLGLLPGLDNFSHIGGFLMGLVLGICILNSPAALRKRIHVDDPPYMSVKHSDGNSPDSGFTGFIKSPVRFFKCRRPAWWAWWFARALSLAAVFIIFILLLNNFYIYRKTCSWCKYLSCININHWCDVGNIQTQIDDAIKKENGTSLNTARSLLGRWDEMAQLYEA